MKNRVSLRLPAVAFTRRWTYFAGLFGVGAIVFAPVQDGAGSAARASVVAPPSFAAYPALAGGEPTGLPLVTSRPRVSADGATPAAAGPTFPASPPAGITEGWPEAESIRKLNVDAPNISAWIAKGIDGELCVLESPHQPVKGQYGVAASCTPAARIGSGATVESEVADSKVVDVTGVVPSGIAAVEVTFANGDVKTIDTTDDAWTLETETPIQSVRDEAIGG